ncbi:hypothetical protein BDK51DRAFT_47437 [Blyttiomyces helicus]|uniref:Uncharacterized protein n=1 Tax=Blyttiomyces helicus TaxID=388810 RepID=A0A4P9VZK7_9FUNG|nr:hypothetical protein BDK51DRAFT_47437 [Blyttiomyces helicus]|eukprot:RKO85261.1 hypothetical protein BDK51DRAFT_47437 [Blyttiomyces helicus]
MNRSRPSRRSLSAVVAAASLAASASATIPARFGAVLAAGPLNLYFLGGDVVNIGVNETPLETNETDLLQSSIVQVSLTSQVATVVPVPVSHSSTRQLAAFARASGRGGGARAMPGISLWKAVPNRIQRIGAFELPYYGLDRSNTSATVVNTFWRFSLTGPPTPTLITAPNAPSPRNMHCATNLGTDSILIYGGRDSSTPWVILSDQYIFNTTTGAWTTGPASASLGALDGAACAAVGGVPYLFGGADAALAIGGIWSYDVGDGVWMAENSLDGPSPRTYASMAAVGSRWLVVSGGEATGVATDNSFYYYDSFTSRWFVNTVGTSMLPTVSLPPSNPSNPPPSGTTLPNLTSSAIAEPPNTTASAASSGSGSSVSAGVITGAAIGGIVFLIFVRWLVWYCTRNKRASESISALPWTSARPPAPVFVGSIPAEQRYHSPHADVVVAKPIDNGGAYHPASASGPKRLAPPSPVSDYYPSAVGQPAQGFAPPTGAPPLPNPTLKNEDLPPTYEENISGLDRNSLHFGAAARVYRGLCTFTPAHEDQIPCKLGDQIIIR